MTNENIFSKGITTLKEEGVKSFLKKTSRFIARIPFRTARKIFPALYYSAAEKFYRKTNEFDTDDWEAPLNPYKVIWISPDKIKRMTGRKMPLPIEKRIRQFGNVEPGDWDNSEVVNFGSWRPEEHGNTEWIYELIMEKEFENSVLFKSIEGRFNREKEWEETKFYQKMIKGLEQGKNSWADYGRTEEEVKERLIHIDDLYESIKSQGFRLEREVDVKSFRRLLNDSILVDISRDGEFLFVEGRRRLSVAKILGVDRVPVRVQVRHPDWMDYRDIIYKNNYYYNHPDFAEFSKTDLKSKSDNV